MVKYKKGNIIKGNVSGVEDYGIFVNIDSNYSGLIHISEISYNFVKDISDFINIGEPIYVKVIDVNEKENQLKLSIKNINYKSGKNKKEVIKETELGFEPLKEKLDEWLKDKLEIIKKENNM